MIPVCLSCAGRSSGLAEQAQGLTCAVRLSRGAMDIAMILRSNKYPPKLATCAWQGMQAGQGAADEGKCTHRVVLPQHSRQCLSK